MARNLGVNSYLWETCPELESLLLPSTFSKLIRADGVHDALFWKNSR